MPEAVGGISVPLTIDRSGWSAQLKAARQEYDQFRSHVSRGGGAAPAAGVGRVGAGMVGAAAGVVPTGQPAAHVAGVSPRFAVSQGAVRDMRIEINKQLRGFAAQGEAVAIPIKLGRVNYGAMRAEISAGLKEIPVTITLDPKSIPVIRAQITRAAVIGKVDEPTKVRARRASGGPVMSYIPRMAAAGQVAGRYARTANVASLTPAQSNFDANIMAAAARLQPHHLQGGVDWYRGAGAYARQQARLHNIEERKAISILAALSAGTAWSSNKTKFEKILRAHSAGKPFPYGMGLDAHVKAKGLLEGTLTRRQAFKTSPKVGQFDRGIAGDLSALVIDLWATRTATGGGMEQPGAARAKIEAAFRKGAKRTGLKNAEFQAALWLLEKEEAGQVPGQVPMGLWRGGRVPRRRMAGTPRRAPGYCSVCRSNISDPILHRSTAKHIANVRGPSRGSGRYLKERPSWMTSLSRWDEQYDEEPPGMWSGGRARAYAATIEQGGGTFDPQGRQPSKGYAVGLAEGTSSQVAQEDRLGFIRGYRQVSKAGSPYVGTWLHEGQIHIDPSGVMARKRQAMSLARKNKQLAIYNIGAGEEINVPPGRRRKLQGGGKAIRDLLSRPGPSKEQLREGYGRRSTGLGQAFGNVPLNTPAGRAQQLLLRALSAEQRQAPIDLAQSMGQLPSALRESGRSKSFEQHARDQQAFAMERLTEQTGLKGRHEPFQSPVMEPTESGMWKTVDPRHMPGLDIDLSKIPRNQGGGKAHGLGRFIPSLFRHPGQMEDVSPRGRVARMLTGPAARAAAVKGYGRRWGVLRRFTSALPGSLGALGEETTFSASMSERSQRDINLAKAMEKLGTPLPHTPATGPSFEAHKSRQSYLHQLKGLPHWAPSDDWDPNDPFEIWRRDPHQGPALGGFSGSMRRDPRSLPTHLIDPTKFPKNARGGWIHRALGGPTEHLDRLFGDIKGMWWNKATGQYHYEEEAETTAERIERMRREADEAFWGGGSRSERARAGRFREQRQQSGFRWGGSGGGSGGADSPPETKAAAPDTLVDKLKRMATQTEQSPHEAEIARMQLRKRGIPGYLMGGFLHRIFGTPKGEGLSRVFRYADPNGLHLRPAAGFQRVVTMHPGVKITGRNLTTDQELTNPESIYSWLLLTARQGHKIELNAEGPGARDVMNLFKELTSFNPEKEGIGYAEHQRSIGLAQRSGLTAKLDAQARTAAGAEGRANRQNKEAIERDLATRNARGEFMTDWERKHQKRAAGGDAEGTYIVNEIGREKFVPDRLSHMIPPDVFEQLPKRQEGGITEIEGHGARLWEAPEDGWIIPARLAGKVPGRQDGTPRGPRGPRVSPGQEDFGFPQTPASMGRLGVSEPEQETWAGMIRRVRPPREGPRATWRGAMTPGTGARDLAAGLGSAFRGAMQGAFQATFGRGRGGAPGPATRGGPGMGAFIPPVGGPPEWEGGPLPGGAAGRAAARRAASGPRPAPPGGGQPQNLVAAHLVEPVTAIRKSFSAINAEAKQTLQQSKALTPTSMVASGLSAEQVARQSMAANRGLTGRAALGGLFGQVLGGAGARKQSFAEGQQFMRQAQALAPEGTPRGVSAVDAWNDVIGQLTDTVGKQTTQMQELETATTDEVKATKAYQDAHAELKGTIDENTTLIDKHKETQAEASELEHQANKKFSAASGGALRNIASMTIAGFAFSALQEGITTAFNLASKAAMPLIDQMEGFSSSATRVTQGLAAPARQLGGNIAATLGGAAGPAGVGGAGFDYLQRRLGGSITAKAAGQAQMETTDLFRAAAGAGNAPTGLMGGYGGLFGTSFLGEFMGGGKGFTEQIAGDLGAFRNQQRVGIERAGLERGAIFGSEEEAVAAEKSAASGFEALNATVKDVNDSYERGLTVSNERDTGLRFMNQEDLKLSDKQAAAWTEQQKNLNEYGETFGKAGVFLVKTAADGTKTLAEGADDWTKQMGTTAAGRLIQSKETFAAQQAQGLVARKQAGEVMTREQIGTEIPFETGMQLAMNPLADAFTGFAKEEKMSRSQRTQLENLNRAQATQAEEGRAGLAGKAAQISREVSPQAAAEFTTLTDNITKLGLEIRDINAGVVDRQATLGFHQYAENLRLVNRSLKDARGLAGQQGGSAFGQMQRQQFMLSRESGRLSLESTRIGLESNALSIELAQRQINFQKAIAGFAVPGVTPEERAANVEAAQIEADFAQKQLDLQKQQQGIGVQQYGVSGKQFALELNVFMEAARRGVVDIEHQRSLLIEARSLEKAQISAQKEIAKRTVTMGDLQAKAQVIANQATNNFTDKIQSAAAYVSIFKGEVKDAAEFIDKAIDNLRGPTVNTGTKPPSLQEEQTGLDALVTGPTTFLAGEAGPEHVLVLRNPRTGSIAGGIGGGGGGGDIIQIMISGNSFSGEKDMAALETRIVAAVEKAQARKLALIGARSH